MPWEPAPTGHLQHYLPSDSHRPAFANDNLFELLQSKDVEINAKPETGPPLWERLLLGLLPALLLVGLFVLLSRRAHRILDACHDTAVDTLTRNRQRSTPSPPPCSATRPSTPPMPTPPPDCPHTPNPRQRAP
ncbi:MAG: hypothetical protein ACRDR6_29030 [Pseudonocardiaceae bacterium]